MKYHLGSTIKVSKYFSLVLKAVNMQPFNPFKESIPFLEPQKISENQRFRSRSSSSQIFFKIDVLKYFSSGYFRESRNETYA